MRHPNKHIQAAIQYAEEHGWKVRKGGGHAFCVIMCGAGIRGACRKSVWSTPRDPEGHAREIRHFVDRCTHIADDDSETEE
ncbi:hypothetical protein [Planctellipticum variicoloris]|uniref:hypothetical protein n=1 Tax=Planctellipticum variicoloris TaxID=3064265 RepID=UPI0030132872|nr:hypothetical protein SH412_001406 [Planctomycetaceae bacterium SH412]